MRKDLIFIIFILLGTRCRIIGQNNLISNGSFETFNSCPPFGNSINYATHWFQPNNPSTSGSSDFYHICACPSFGCPPNSAGFQYPRTGGGYAGIAFFFDSTISNRDKWREYIEVGLTDTLRFQRKYCIRFYVSKGNWSSYAVKNIQAVLTNDTLQYNDPNFTFISGVTPFMEADSIITDTLNWTKIETTYTANGGERFLTIGNFNSGLTTSYQYVWPFSGSPNTLGYYLIDDVSIYEQPEIFAGNDTVLTLGDSVQLGLTGRPDIFYSWTPTSGLNNPNIANPKASPGITTTYTLTVTDTNQLACINTFTDTVRVQVGSNGINEQQNNFSLRVYPNPFDEKTTFQTNVSSQYEIRVFDIVGKLLLETAFEGNEFILKDAELNSGIYFYEIRNKNGDAVKGKFFKK
jgi:hypothetical protein